jgi:hypothetical protein
MFRETEYRDYKLEHWTGNQHYCLAIYNPRGKYILGFGCLKRLPRKDVLRKACAIIDKDIAKKGSWHSTFNYADKKRGWWIPLDKPKKREAIKLKGKE